MNSVSAGSFGNLCGREKEFSADSEHQPISRSRVDMYNNPLSLQVAVSAAVCAGGIKPREASTGSTTMVATWAATVVKWWPVITKNRTSTIP